MNEPERVIYMLVREKHYEVNGEVLHIGNHDLTSKAMEHEMTKDMATNLEQDDLAKYVAGSTTDNDSTVGKFIEENYSHWLRNLVRTPATCKHPAW